MILNQYSIWRYILILIVVVVGCIYAAPNMYGDYHAVQIKGDGFVIQETELSKIMDVLEDAEVEAESGKFEQDSILIRLKDGDAQLKAQKAIKQALGNEYIVALNLLADTPEWLRGLNALPMYLGLDLRGGIHFLLQVDMDKAIEQRVAGDVGSIRSVLRDNKLRSKTSASGNTISIRFNSAEFRDTALPVLQDEYADLSFTSGQDGNTPIITAELREQALRDERKAALTQNITALRNRVNELGVSEPIVQQDGEDRIIVQLPGVQDSTRAKEIIGATATLEYHLVHGVPGDAAAEEAARTGRVPAGSKLYHYQGQPVLFDKSVIVSGEHVTGATPGFDQNNMPVAYVNLNSKGGARMRDVTGENIGKNMGVLFIETKPGDTKPTIKVISVARIADQLYRRFMTTGLTQKEAQDLSLLLRAGALKAPMKFIEERTVGASLGDDNISQGYTSVKIGLALVLLFMIVYYRVFGLVANVALVLNLVLLVAILSMLQATLTMPGIAGIVLTVGMAVDANVLIFERIREELRNGNSVQASIHAGYKKAFATIADANITTFLVAFILFALGTGPVKGFAVTLSIGILTSMFTAIVVTRAIVNLLYGTRNAKKLMI